jgi:hypothetical protein
MPIYDATFLKTMNFSDRGLPFVNIEASTTADTTTFISYFTNFGIFYGATGAVATISTNNVYVKKADGSWVQCLEIYANVSGSWKRVDRDNFYIKEGSSWKS